MLRNRFHGQLRHPVFPELGFGDLTTPLLTGRRRLLKSENTHNQANWGYLSHPGTM
ncbi:hypothetical protein LEMLEM_LOCUS4486 [Lemmus lemmus]